MIDDKETKDTVPNWPENTTEAVAIWGEANVMNCINGTMAHIVDDELRAAIQARLNITPEEMRENVQSLHEAWKRRMFEQEKK